MIKQNTPAVEPHPHSIVRTLTSGAVEDLDPDHPYERVRSRVAAIEALKMYDDPTYVVHHFRLFSRLPSFIDLRQPVPHSSVYHRSHTSSQICISRAIKSKTRSSEKRPRKVPALGFEQSEVNIVPSLTVAMDACSSRNRTSTDIKG